MSTFKLNVKWQKEKYCDVECNTAQDPAIFKALLFSLTGVPPERQKVMMPGGMLGDSYDGIKLRNGANIMLMGTAEEIKVITNMDEVPEHVQESIEKVVYPHGLTNLGNTCYMNAVIQLLYACPELAQALTIVNKGDSILSDNNDAILNNNLSLVFDSLRRANKPVVPAFFLATLHFVYPRFAATQGGPSGKSVPAMGNTTQMGGSEFMTSVANLAAMGSSGQSLMQQDANEFWQVLIRTLQKATVATEAIQSANQKLPGSFGMTGGWNPVDRFMTGRLDTKFKCKESEEEPVSNTIEEFTQLSCFINKDVKYLHTGIRNGLQDTITKKSDVLDRDVNFSKESLISRLPGYLTVQFVRFFYKEKEQINAKVLKDVKFPFSLDIYEFCTPELCERLVPMREVIRIEEDRQASVAPKQKVGRKPEKEPEIKDEDLAPYWFDDDLGSNNTGCYELCGVVTHQGRSSNQGHYVAWVKQKNRWVKFDDDEVSFVPAEDILRLSGGGDWHCAYILLYSPKRVAKEWIANAEIARAKAVTTNQKANGTTKTTISNSETDKMSVDGGDK